MAKIRVRDVSRALDEFAPLRLAESWDNVGLIAGDPESEASRVLLCIDFTRAVCSEIQRGDVVVSYHPPIFQGVKRLLAGTEIFRAIQEGVAIYSPHTALDAALGGTNDALADALGLTATRPLRPAAPEDDVKLVTFVPEDAVGKVSEALFAAGAGQIGNYSQCSFRSEGTGTFFGGDATKPAVGQKGQLETVKELRIETVVSGKKLAAVVEALRASHPYETPAFDLVRLQAAPDAKVGLGRVGEFSGTRRALVDTCKRALGIDRVLAAGSLDGAAKRVAVAAGAGATLLDDALRAKADVFVTGELKHHDALRAASRGLTVLMTLHSNSERVALSNVAKAISRALPDLPVAHSAADRDPYAFV